MWFKPEVLEFVKEERSDIGGLDGVGNDNETDAVFCAQILLNEVAVLLVLKTIFRVLVHERVVVIVLGAIVFNSEFQFFVIDIEFKVFFCDGVLEEIRTHLCKGFLKKEFDKFFTLEFALACSALKPSLSLMRKGVTINGRAEKKTKKMIIDIRQAHRGRLVVHAVLIDDEKNQECKDNTPQEYVPSMCFPKISTVPPKSHLSLEK